MPKRTLKEADKKIIAYGQSWKCGICDAMLPPSFQVDHIIPFSISSDDSEENLMALCANCHANKTQKEHARILEIKKMKGRKKINICWFCLEQESEGHVCDRQLKKVIDDSKNDINFDTLCEKMKHTSLEVSSTTGQGGILKVEINFIRRTITVDNI